MILRRYIAWTVDSTVLSLLAAPALLWSVPLFGLLAVGGLTAYRIGWHHYRAATPGKLLVGLVLTANEADQARIPWSTAILRELPLAAALLTVMVPGALGVLLFFPGVAWFAADGLATALRRDGRALHDLLVGTSVHIREPSDRTSPTVWRGRRPV